MELSGAFCPLTSVENALRQLAGSSGYPGGFIEHYVQPIVYPPGLTPGIQVLLGIAVLVLNAGAYAWILSRWRARRSVA